MSWYLGEWVSLLYNVAILSLCGVFPVRMELRQILLDHFGHEFDARQPGFKPTTVTRTPLNCLGPWHQHHVDGHEKLSKFALRIGEVTLPIYGWRDQFTSVILLLITVPNVRLAETCGHLYLDVVEEHGCW